MIEPAAKPAEHGSGKSNPVLEASREMMHSELPQIQEGDKLYRRLLSMADAVAYYDQKGWDKTTANNNYLDRVIAEWNQKKEKGRPRPGQKWDTKQFLDHELSELKDRVSEKQVDKAGVGHFARALYVYHKVLTNQERAAIGKNPALQENLEGKLVTVAGGQVRKVEPGLFLQAAWASPTMRQQMNKLTKGMFTRAMTSGNAKKLSWPNQRLVPLLKNEAPLKVKDLLEAHKVRLSDAASKKEALDALAEAQDKMTQKDIDAYAGGFNFLRLRSVLEALASRSVTLKGREHSLLDEVDLSMFAPPHRVEDYRQEQKQEGGKLKVISRLPIASFARIDRIHKTAALLAAAEGMLQKEAIEYAHAHQAEYGVRFMAGEAGSGGGMAAARFEGGGVKGAGFTAGGQSIEDLLRPVAQPLVDMLIGFMGRMAGGTHP